MEEKFGDTGYNVFIFNEDILKVFNLESETVHEPVNVMKICELLDFMKACAERIDQKSKRYISCDDADVQLDCIDIVTAKLNDFVQVFMDLVVFLRKSEGTYKEGRSLRYCMAAFDSFEFQGKISCSYLLSVL